MDLHRGGGFTQGRWIYTGAVDLHRGGGFTQGRWIYTGAVGRWAVDLQSAVNGKPYSSKQNGKQNSVIDSDSDGINWSITM